MEIKKIIITILVTVVLVELFGYIWHRFSAHLGYAGDTIRTPHYEHHEVYYPYTDMEAEEYRIKGLFNGDSWPWFVPITLFIMGLGMLWYMNRVDTTIFIIMTITLLVHVYVISYIHDSYHITNHWLNQFSWYKKNKIYHNLHHYYNCNYGISNYSMDFLFGTLCTEYDKNKGKQNIFEGYVYNK
jgi:sterol desaturase/sphingolipid hydroxylase (fatty acid hydroxylase superfamily)